MPTIETMKASDAPPPPKNMSQASQEILDAVNGLKKDEVLRMQPDPDKRLRGLKTAVGRVASSNDLTLETWTDPAEDSLYVRKARS